MDPHAPPTLLTGARVVGPEGERRADVRLEEGRVSREAIGRAGDLVVPLDGHLLFPGLLNAHEHLGLNAFPEADAGGPRASAYDWIDALQPLLASDSFREVKRVDEALRARHGALKNLLSGVTTVAHHDPWLAEMGDPSFPVRVVHPYGWCHSLRFAGRYGPTVAEALAATPAGARFFVHLAEGTDAEAAGELSRLERLGGLGPATVLVHGVGLGEAGVARVIERGAAVVWCPASNLRVLGATLDPRALLAVGRLALGSDSRLSGASDLLAELGVARESAGLEPEELLRLVTTAAAAVLGRPDAGHLSAGAVADVVVVRDEGGDPAGALTDLPRARLRAVVLGGVPRVADADLRPWLEAAGVPVRHVLLDGVPKVVDARLFTEEASALEPGLSSAAE
ncbi:MAG TPA: amidohydrolase family protein [Thermoanaerobaculia bacterium]|jgi:cytosine/adenosine deaminase-related metal-dependent hydrolase|nr:amidohydrolase family protein [Thermoanaerobaculia bacterium]HPA50992.1 amidohydrolase family protein [Thermoanaerobaculia bacterium]HQN06284.1 amidohydrolase family protein [Thermoanaerobaculia bacterium]HQP86600.1 amidohydrolase family protein [Thermoanaerobaculia bacterium]